MTSILSKSQVFFSYCGAGGACIGAIIGGGYYAKFGYYDSYRKYKQDGNIKELAHTWVIAIPVTGIGASIGFMSGLFVGMFWPIGIVSYSSHKLWQKVKE